MSCPIRDSGIEVGPGDGCIIIFDNRLGNQGRRLHENLAHSQNVKRPFKYSIFYRVLRYFDT